MDKDRRSLSALSRELLDGLDDSSDTGRQPHKSDYSTAEPRSFNKTLHIVLKTKNVGPSAVGIATNGMVALFEFPRHFFLLACTVSSYPFARRNTGNRYMACPDADLL